MANKDGDAYPDPSRVLSGKCKVKVLICTIFLFICFSSFIAMISAPGDQLPDPSCVIEPIFDGYFDGNSLIGNPILANPTFFTIE